MTAYQFDRDYSLYIGEPNSKDGFLIKGLNIEFDIKHVIDNKIKAGNGTIHIHNLSQDTYKKLQVKENYVRLLAGYTGTGIGEILLGNTTDVTTTKDKENIVTKITVAEAYSILHGVKLVTAQPGGTTVKELLLDVIKKAGANVGTITGAGVDKRLLYGYSTAGTLKFILDEICSAYRLTWCTVGGKIDIKDEGQALPAGKVEAIVLSKETGLIGIPAYKEYNYGTKKDEKIKKTGISFECLLNHRIKPGSLVIVDSSIGAVPKGEYMVQTVDFKGQFRGKDWLCSVLCDEV